MAHVHRSKSENIAEESAIGIWILAGEENVRAGDHAAQYTYLQANSNGNVTNDGYYICVATLKSGPNFTKSGFHAVRTTLTKSTVLEDKLWIAVDNITSSFSGNVYATWTHFTATSSMIFFSRSTNHGVTWSKAIQINPTSQNGAIQGSQVAIGTNGEVYVSYELFTGTGATGVHEIAKSTNGGVSFGTAVASPLAGENFEIPGFGFGKPLLI